MSYLNELKKIQKIRLEHRNAKALHWDAWFKNKDKNQSLNYASALNCITALFSPLYAVESMPEFLIQSTLLRWLEELNPV